MDVPIKLETETTVSDLAEIKQTLKILFENETKSFMQSPNRGCTGIIHTTGNAMLVNLYVQGVIDQVDGCELQSTAATFGEDGEVLTIEVGVKYELESFRLVYKEGEWQ